MIEFQNSGKHTVHTKNYRDFNWLVTLQQNVVVVLPRVMICI